MAGQKIIGVAGHHWVNVALPVQIAVSTHSGARLAMYRSKTHNGRVSPLFKKN
jgi:hypothetical protein